MIEAVRSDADCGNAQIISNFGQSGIFSPAERQLTYINGVFRLMEFTKIAPTRLLAPTLIALLYAFGFSRAIWISVA